jgi:membrane-bound metal-dependent hydrolase YbcI (DUF457 family)
MSNGKDHKMAGIVGGVALSLARTRDGAEWVEIIFRAAAAGIGGALGAKIPDILEPAKGRYHRDFAHSFLGAAIVIKTGGDLLRHIDGWASERAAKARADAEAAYASGDTFGWLLSTVARLFFEALVGLTTGLLGGYLSHLALDFFTPDSIPLLVAKERYVFRALGMK